MSSFDVLMYHEIIKRENFDLNNNSNLKVNSNYQDVLPKPLFVFEDEFESQMKYLYDNGYKTLKLEEIIDFYYNHKPLPEKSVLLTFDDMYKSLALYAYPILKKYNFNAVGFVVYDWIFNTPQKYSCTESVCMSKEELEQIQDVFEFANHTKALHTRKEGLTALQTVDKTTFLQDSASCSEFVDVKNVYAYPFGVFTEDIISWLKESKFLLAFTTEGGKNNINVDPLKLHRNGVFVDFNIDKFINILEN